MLGWVHKGFEQTQLAVLDTVINDLRTFHCHVDWFFTVATHRQLLSLHYYSNVFILMVCYQAHEILNQNSLRLIGCVLDQVEYRVCILRMLNILICMLDRRCYIDIGSTWYICGFNICIHDMYANIESIHLLKHFSELVSYVLGRIHSAKLFL